MASAQNPSKEIAHRRERLPTNALSTHGTAQSTQVQVLEQPIECVQSQELVQIMVCAVISTVSSLRCLFPEDCFKVHHYDVENPNHSYRDFKQAVSETQIVVPYGHRRTDHRYVPWEVLVPGINSGVDKLLDWLERGVADALSHKYLNTLQLGIYDGEVSLSKRIETYVMAFSYAADDIQIELQLSTAHGIPPPPGKTIGSIKQELRFLVHRLANHIGGFPQLPTNSIVNMHFTYNDTCPPAYQPPGFVVCHDHGLIVRGDQGAMVGSINPGPHRVDLRVFLNEDKLEVSNSPNPLTMVTLRGSTGRIRRVGSIMSNGEETEVMEQILSKSNIPALATLHRRSSIVSNSTATPDTQERAQLAAISNMARLRSVHNELPDTQVLDTQAFDMIVSRGDRFGSVDLDGEPSAKDESSTQGSPSTVGGRRSARQAALRSLISSPRRDAPMMLHARKREAVTTDEDRTTKFQKVSKARSPFATASLRK